MDDKVQTKLPEETYRRLNKAVPAMTPTSFCFPPRSKATDSFRLSGSLLAFGICLALSPLNGSAFAEDPLHAPVESLSLEQIPNQLRQCDESVLNETATFLAVVEREIDAKRISGPAGQALRLALCVVKAPITTSAIDSVTQNSFLPPDIENVAKAAKDLQSAWEACKNQRTALMKRGLSEIGRRTTEDGRSAKRADEIGSLLAAIDGFFVAAQPRLNDAPGMAGTKTVSGCVEFLQVLRESLEFPYPQTSNEPKLMLGRLESSAKGAKDLAPELDVSERISGMARPFVTAAEESRKALESALLTQKSRQEVFTALEAYEIANSRRMELVPTHDDRESTELMNSPGVYRRLAYGVVTIETHQWIWARTHIENVRKELAWLGPKREPVFGEFLTKLEGEIAKGTKADERKETEELRAKLNAVKQPADLDSIAMELFSEEQIKERNGAPFLFKEAASVLESVAEYWRAGNPLTQMGWERVTPLAAISGDLENLRQRIDRDLLSRFLRAPELNQPPLADRPLKESLETLCTNLAANGEWRRVIECRKAQMLDGESGHALMAAIDSIQAFLAGQNFELAEEWKDAVTAYNKVIQNNLEGTPVKEAVDRLKVIKKEHPEAV